MVIICILEYLNILNINGILAREKITYLGYVNPINCEITDTPEEPEELEEDLFEFFSNVSN